MHYFQAFCSKKYKLKNKNCIPTHSLKNSSSKAISSTCNLRMRHAMVTGDLHNMGVQLTDFQYHLPAG
jgi:SET domain-containing protein